MSFFRREKPSAEILRKAAGVMAEWRDVDTRLLSVGIILRARWAALGYSVENVERAIDWMLR